MNKPFTVVITESKPPYAPEALLRLYAESEEDAKKKASEWILKAHTIFAEEGHVTEDQLEEDIEIVDIPDDDGTVIGTQIAFVYDGFEPAFSDQTDETEFDTADEKEAMKLFEDFVKENGYRDVKIVEIRHDPVETDEPKAASGRHTGLTVKATVTFQRWEDDYARFNGEAEFDACDALDSMSDEELAQIERNDPYALDNVYLRAVAFGQIHDYDGPFEVDLDEDNLSDYLEARRSEHGTI